VLPALSETLAVPTTDAFHATLTTIKSPTLVLTALHACVTALLTCPPLPFDGVPNMVMFSSYLRETARLTEFATWFMIWFLLALNESASVTPWKFTAS